MGPIATRKIVSHYSPKNSLSASIPYPDPNQLIANRIAPLIERDMYVCIVRLRVCLNECACVLLLMAFFWKCVPTLITKTQQTKFDLKCRTNFFSSCVFHRFSTDEGNGSAEFSTPHPFGQSNDCKLIFLFMISPLKCAVVYINALQCPHIPRFQLKGDTFFHVSLLRWKWSPEVVRCRPRVLTALPSPCLIGMVSVAGLQFCEFFFLFPALLRCVCLGL